MSRRNTAQALLIAGLLCAHLPHLAAQSSQRHHVIVLLDRSGSMRDHLSDALPLIRDTLPDLCLEPGRVLKNPARALIDSASRRDRLSARVFGLDYLTATSFAEFVSFWPGTDGLPRAGVDRSTFGDLLDGIQADPLRVFSTRWTGLSLALPLALVEQGRYRETTAEPYDRTFVILISDETYNVANPTLELGEFQSGLKTGSSYETRTARPLLQAIDGVQARLRQVQKYFLLDPVGEDHPVGDVHLRVFEAIPNTWAIGIESVWQFEQTEFRFRRAADGFHSEFPLRPLGVEHLKPYRTEAVLLERGREIDREVFPGSATDTSVRFSLPRSAASASDLKVRLRFWVRYTDSVYGMQLLSPDGSALQGSAGLVREVPVTLEPADRVLGLVPLPFWAFRFASAFGLSSQFAATWFWNVIVLIVGAVALVFLIWRRSTVRDVGRVVVD